jgi:nitrous oxidase accessory protein
VSAAVPRRVAIALGALILWIAAPIASGAVTVRVAHDGPVADIASALALAQPGDTVRVEAGTYFEYQLTIDKPIVLVGVGDPVIDAHDQGEILLVTAPGTVIRGFTFKNVGVSFMEDRAAVRVRRAGSVVVEDNRLENAFFGIYIEHSDDVVIRGNVLAGLATREVTTGNGIHLWYCKRARIENNEVRGHRDGIYFEFVENSVVRGNVSANNLRYGLHFMFSHEDDYIDNRFIANGAGVAVMYTHTVVMRGNLFERNWGMSSYGLLLKDINDSDIRDNVFRGNTVGLYTEGSNRLTVEENQFIDNGYATRIMANSMDNVFRRNVFRGNAFDVSTNSRQNFNTFDSNYWSEYTVYDLDGDGVGDVPHHPVRLFSLLVENTPPGVVLLGSLFVSLIDTAERVMPVLTPETLVDSHPLMSAEAVVQTVARGEGEP